MKTLYWHDYETWGVSPSQDKPSQFAGIRTDENLNIIGEPLMVYCQPNLDCLPHPEACLVTGLTPQKAMLEGLPEPEFIKRIHNELAYPETCGVGYNSIRFDDEVTRYGLYRNFYDPYEREWKHGNSRWDIIDMVRMVYALRPETLSWPQNNDGTVSFRLELLSAENGLVHEAAHDALSDVYATIALAKLIKERQPKLFDYAYSLRFKREVASYIDLEQRKPFLHISSRFPASRGCAAIMAPLMMHPSNKNSVICVDLSVSPVPLLNLSAEEVIERLYTRQADLPEGIERIALKEVHLNKSPMVATLKLMDQATAVRLSIDRELCEQHWQQLLHMNLKEKLTSVYQHKPFAQSSDPEQQLYDGFISDADKQLLSKVQTARPSDLALLGEQFKDQRLRALLFRYRARHYAESLSESEQQQWHEWCYYRLTDPEAGASIVLDDYFERLSALAEKPDVNQTLLQVLFDYGDECLASLG